MNPFKRLNVTFAPTGGSVILWTMSARFYDPLPHSYQLQVALTSAPNESDWMDVGTAVDNSFFAIDDTRRIVSKNLDVHYRVVLTTPVDTYVSPTGSSLEYLERRDWLLARDQVRQVKKLISKYTGCYEGYLLKRKRFGPNCTRCTMPTTEEPTDSKCPICYGTGIVAGYYRAVPDFWVELGNSQSREKVDLQATATSRPVVVQAFAAGDLLLNSRDVFHATRSGRRWFIETLSTVAEFRGHIVKYSLELRQAPFSDVVYQVPLSGS